MELTEPRSMTCIKTYSTVADAQSAAARISQQIITEVYWSDFVERWCLSVPKEDARAAYYRLTYLLA